MATKQKSTPVAFDAYAQLLPCDESSELTVIRTSLKWDHRMREAMAMLVPEHFSLDRHRFVWSVMRRLHDNDDPVTMASLFAELSKLPSGMDDAGGFGYVCEFRDDIDAPDLSQDFWIRPILETYSRRRLMLKCNEVLIRLSDRGESPAEICQEIEDEARNCAAVGEPASGFSSFIDTVTKCGGMDAFLKRGAGDAVAYPWSSLNRMTNGGMKPGQVIVIGAPTGTGKTTAALNIAHTAARSESGCPVVFSLEMDEVEIQKKLLALASKVDSYRFENPDEAEMRRIRQGIQYLSANKILVYGDDEITVPAIKARVKKLMATEPVSVVIVDYIQLVEGVRDRGETREQEISRIMRGLKRMAMQLKVPVVALSQILEDAGAGTREPELKDLRESRSIGHTANMVAFLHFTKRYDMANGTPTGELDLIVRKQRGGPEGRFPMKFNAPTGKFYEEVDQ